MHEQSGESDNITIVHTRNAKAHNTYLLTCYYCLYYVITVFYYHVITVLLPLVITNSME